MGESPFLDLLWHFQIDLDALIKYLQETTPTIFTSMDFDSYKARAKEEVRDSLLGELWQFDEDTQFEDCHLYTSYIVEMDPSVFTAEALVEHYSRLKTYFGSLLVDPTFQESFDIFDDFMRHIVLEPALKWAGHPKVNENHAREILDFLECAIDDISRRLRSPNMDANLLEYQNNLIFCYLIVASSLKQGISTYVICSHLEAFRSVGSAAWAKVDKKTRMQYAVLTLRLVRNFYRPGSLFKPELGFGYNSLADFRAVLDDAAGTSVDAPFTVHQWVFRWFKDKIDTEVFSVRRYETKAASLSVLSDGEQIAAVELCNRFASYRLPVTIHHIQHFLLQFGTTLRIRGALRLLMHSKFYPLWELGEVMQRLLAKDLGDDPESRLVVAPFGDQSGSTAIIKYLASHSPLAARIHIANDISSALKQTNNGDSLYFVDDCLLSGTQTLNTLGDLMGTRKRKPHHTIHCKELNSQEKAALLQRSLVFSYCVATNYGEKIFATKLLDVGIDPERTELRFGILEHTSSKAFAPMGPVAWASVEEREALKEFAIEVGYDILKRRAKIKSWNDERRKESALGFSDFQRLLIFPYNVPKTTVTLLWERGMDSMRWQPLFPVFD